MIAGVLFDLGGTLLDYEAHANWQDTLASSYRAVHEELAIAGYRGEAGAFQRLFSGLEDRLWREAELGREKPTTETLVQALLGMVDLAPEPTLVDRCVRAYARTFQDGCEAYPDSQPALAALRSRRLKVGLLSNTILPGRAHTEDLARFGLLRYFDDLVYSSDAGLWKPRPEVFDHALSRLGLRPEQALFVGDKPEYDVLGAHNAGLRAALIDRSSQYRRALGPSEGTSPDWHLQDLTELPGIIDALADM